MNILLVAGYSFLFLFLTETVAFCDLLTEVKSQKTSKGSGKVDNNEQKVLFVKCGEKMEQLYSLEKYRFTKREGDCTKPEGRKSVKLVEIDGTAVKNEKETVVQDAKKVNDVFPQAAIGDRILIVEDNKDIEFQLVNTKGELKQAISFSSISKDASGLKFMRSKGTGPLTAEDADGKKSSPADDKSKAMDNIKDKL